MYSEEGMKAILGKTITAIHMDDDNLVFETDQGLVGFYVDGDCCSSSYFYDFYGVENLLNNGPVTAFEMVDLAPGDPGYRPETWEQGVGSVDYSEVAAYGYRFTTVHPMFGEVSSVVSFRNSSNGYYGGSMHLMNDPQVTASMKQIRRDQVGPIEEPEVIDGESYDAPLEIEGTEQR